MDTNLIEYFRTYAEIDLGAIKKNLKELKKKIEPGVMSLAIVKADAYGHGAVGVAKYICDDVDYFGIATLGEAVELRNAGVHKPILILSSTSHFQYETLVNNELTQTIFHYKDAVALSDVAVRLNKTAKIHIALDTGMTRIGFFCDEKSLETVKKITELPNLCVEGIFSHYACADSVDRTVTDSQTEKFEYFIGLLEKSGIDIPIKHLCNSAGLLSGEKQFDMVRLGIVLYGLLPDECMSVPDISLEPAMKIVSHVIHIKDVPAGSGVSYGHTFYTERDSKIAVVCIGYADGYSRALSNKGRVLINGCFAPVIGRVCMDQLMVDITDLKGVEVGDNVILLGKSGDEIITAEEIAELTGTINYEVVCQFQKRVSIVHHTDYPEA